MDTVVYKHSQDNALYPGQHFSNRSTCPMGPTLQQAHQTIPAPHPKQAQTSKLPLCLPRHYAFLKRSLILPSPLDLENLLIPSPNQTAAALTRTAVLANLLHAEAPREHGALCRASWGQEPRCSQPGMPGRGSGCPDPLRRPTPSTIEHPSTTRTFILALVTHTRKD